MYLFILHSCCRKRTIVVVEFNFRTCEENEKFVCTRAYSEEGWAEDYNAGERIGGKNQGCDNKSNVVDCLFSPVELFRLYSVRTRRITRAQPLNFTLPRVTPRLSQWSR